MESGLVHPHPASPHGGVRSRSDQCNTGHQGYSYNRYPEETDPYGGQPSTAHPQASYQGTLKRPFSQCDAGQSADTSQDDGSRTSVNQDNKLLSFRRAQDKLTITDQRGHLQQLDLSAQLHGMFFLSEMPSNAADGPTMQPELTCYRRNLFQISGNLVTPRGPLNVITESGESVLVSSMEVTISAIESVDNHSVRLIVIPWKTPPPNSPEIAQGPDQEPPALPLIPFQEEGAEADGELAVYPIGWRRLQFRIATANNGRRKELQQHFTLHLKVHATLANNTKVVLTESTTAPIVVRGRSPRNFQARKEIPLLGSSAGSRGQALVETGMGVVAGSMTMKPQEPKPRERMDMQVPRTAFTFTTPKPPSAQISTVRSQYVTDHSYAAVTTNEFSSTYPSWTSPTNNSLRGITSTGANSYSAPAIGAEMYSKVSLAGGSNFGGEGQDLPIPTTLPASVPLSLISEEPGSMHRFVDDGRPSKALRLGSGPSTASGGSVAGTATSPDYRYGSFASATSGSGDVMAPTYGTDGSVGGAAAQRDAYSGQQGWRHPSDANAVPYGGSDARSYGSSSYDQYKPRSGEIQPKSEPGQGSHLDAYSHRGSFDGTGNYSWGNN
ncbi:Transcription factor-like protein [Emericellopsis cladophorae]|uniref:Transcription factor-like protein n=1 Tax=Emericellopsis cladophorae TaxID=2686198 RepID=A0A9P9Y4R8_9HYPO|nr:Transcription factor-like protein [Emericellopsis cladophorae]KAI6782924.1 Transcription factor-like protein [Emericellopsis cladophorae]